MPSRSVAAGAFLLLAAGCAEGTFKDPLDQGLIIDAGPSQTLDGAPDPEIGIRVVNAGSLKASAVPSVAMLEIASALRDTGPDIGPVKGVASDISPTTLGGVEVVLENQNDRTRRVKAPLLYVSKDQVNFVVPENFEGARPPLLGPLTIRINYMGKTNIQKDVVLDHVVPGLFTADGSGMGPATGTAFLTHDDKSQELPAPIAKLDGTWSTIPIDFGVTKDMLSLMLRATGTRGQTDLSKITVTLGGTKVPVDAVEPQAALGLELVKITVPRTLAGKGEVDVVLTAIGTGGERSSNVVRVAFK